MAVTERGSFLISLRILRVVALSASATFRALSPDTTISFSVAKFYRQITHLCYNVLIKIYQNLIKF